MGRTFANIRNPELQEWYKPYVIEAFHCLFPLRKDSNEIHCGKLTSLTDHCLLKFFETLHLYSNERAVSNSFIQAICNKLNYEAAFCINTEPRWGGYEGENIRKSFTRFVKTDKNILRTHPRNITWIKSSFVFDKKFSYTEYFLDHKKIVLEYDGENIADLCLNAIDENVIEGRIMSTPLTSIDYIINKTYEIATNKKDNISFQYSSWDLDIILIKFLVELLNR